MGRIEFRLQLLEASVRDQNPLLADLLLDLADEARDAVDKVKLAKELMESFGTPAASAQRTTVAGS